MNGDLDQEKLLEIGHALNPLPPVPVAFTLGADTGPSTGFGLISLRRIWLPRAFQCNAAAAPWLLRQILEDLEPFAPGTVRCGIEAFAPGHGAGGKKYGTRVSRQVQELAEICGEYGVPVTARFAQKVKNWATDKRLREAGLYDITAGGTHSRDGMRHSLMEAVEKCGYPDPLSKRKPALDYR
jgi:hypothetical protein